MKENLRKSLTESWTEGLTSFYQEVCLLERPYMHDPDKTVSGRSYRNNCKGLVKNINIRRFARYKMERRPAKA